MQLIAMRTLLQPELPKQQQPRARSSSKLELDAPAASASARVGSIAATGLPADCDGASRGARSESVGGDTHDTREARWERAGRTQAGPLSSLARCDRAGSGGGHARTRSPAVAPFWSSPRRACVCWSSLCWGAVAVRRRCGCSRAIGVRARREARAAQTRGVSALAPQRHCVEGCTAAKHCADDIGPSSTQRSAGGNTETQRRNATPTSAAAAAAEKRHSAKQAQHRERNNSGARLHRGTHSAQLTPPPALAALCPAALAAQRHASHRPPLPE